MTLLSNFHIRPLGPKPLSAPSETRLPGLPGPGRWVSDPWSTLARDTGWRCSWNQKAIAKPQETTLKVKTTGAKLTKKISYSDKMYFAPLLVCFLFSVVGHSTCVRSAESWSQSVWGTQVSKLPLSQFKGIATYKNDEKNTSQDRFGKSNYCWFYTCGPYVLALGVFFSPRLWCLWRGLAILPPAAFWCRVCLL